MLLEAREQLITLEEKDRVSSIHSDRMSRNETINETLLGAIKVKLVKAQEHADAKDTAVSEMLFKIKSMKAEQETKTKLVASKEMTDRVEKESSKLKAEFKKKQSEDSFKSDVLFNNFEALRFEHFTLQNEHIIVKNDREIWETKAVMTKRDYDALHNEAHKILYLIEKKEKEMNKLRDQLKVAGSGTTAPQSLLILDETKPLEMANRRVVKENERLKKERDHFHQIWVDEHAEALQYKETIVQLNKKLSDLDSRVYIGDAILKKDEDIEKGVKEQLTEYKISASRYKAEYQRVKIDSLKHEAKTLERKLLDSTAKIEESKYNEKILKSEVKRLYQAQSETRKDDSFNQSRSNTNERKIMVLKEIVEKLKKERNGLTTSVHEYKTKSETCEKKYTNLKIEFAHFNNVVSRKGINFKKTESTSLPHLTSDKSMSAQKLDSQLTTAWRLKIESLTHQREFLEIENKSLKTRMTTQQIRLDKTESQLTVSTSTLKKQTTLATTNTSTNTLLAAQLARAERLAAHIERQFKDSAPDVKIDYHRIGVVDPSVQLVSALMVKESTGKYI